MRALLDDASLPEHGAPADALLREATDLLFEHSLFTGHPRFLGYVIGAPAPLGALADLLASAVNPNLGGYPLSPVATEIERQTVQWIAELIGYRPDCGGLLVSGGNMANFIGVLAARRAQAPWDVRAEGMGDGRLRMYCSAEAHTWVQKAADMFGFGTEALRWIPTDATLRMDVAALRTPWRPTAQTACSRSWSWRRAARYRRAPWIRCVSSARSAARRTSGCTSTAPTARSRPRRRARPTTCERSREADSIALDPHKWLYAPTEAGCALVRSDADLLAAFDYTPPYYSLDAEELHYYKRGPQNSRGFKALKVWLSLRHLGRDGYARLIEEDMRLARELDELVDASPSLERGPGGLSISTFRYAPEGELSEEELDELNGAILARLQKGGEAFVSVAQIDGRHWLRSCIVNFRTTHADLEALVEVVTRLGVEALATTTAR